MTRARAGSASTAPAARRSALGTPHRMHNPRDTWEVTVHALVWIGIVLLVLWGVLWLGFNIVSGVVHLLVIAAIALIAWGLLKKGARAVDRRL
jgi:Flp pilus assembly protein TadB